MLRSVSAVSATTPPLLSRTTPVMAPLKLCALASIDVNAMIADARHASHTRRHEGMGPPGFEREYVHDCEVRPLSNTNELVGQYEMAKDDVALRATESLRYFAHDSNRIRD